MMKINFVLAALLAITSAGLSAAEYDAVLVWPERVELGVLVNGVVKEIPVTDGQRVKKDQLLLKLDESVFLADVNHAKADLKKAQELLIEAKRELERVEELYNRTVSSEHELEQANLGHTRALADEKKAEAVLVKKKAALKFSAIHAPFDGVVLTRNASVGQTIISTLQSRPMITLASTGRMLARITVDTGKVSALKEGSKAEVRIDGKTFNGSVFFVGLEPIKPAGSTTLYPVDISFSDLGETLRAGQNVKVVID